MFCFCNGNSPKRQKSKKEKKVMEFFSCFLTHYGLPQSHGVRKKAILAKRKSCNKITLPREVKVKYHIEKGGS